MKSKIVIAIVGLTLCFSGVALAKKDKEKRLPPGLQKKVSSGKPLPPGWQKKLAVGEKIDQEVYDNSQVVLRDKKGLLTIKVEGKLVKLVENTREIVEIIEGI